MPTQHSPRSPTNKRRFSETVSPQGENIIIRTQSIPGNFHNIVGDTSKYKAIIVPIELAPIFENLLTELLAKIKLDKNKTIEVHDDDEVFTKSIPNDEKIEAFLDDFGSSKRLFDNILRKTNVKELINDVDPSNFESFKNARKIISKWFITGSHLVNKIKGDSASNRYLKVHFDYSIAVTDPTLKEKCTNKLLNTKKLIEQSLTSSVIDRAITLNNDVQTLWENTPNLIFLKAYRVVSRANKHLSNPTNDPQNPPRGNRPNPKFDNRQRRESNYQKDRNVYQKYDWNNRRPKRDSHIEHTHPKQPPRKNYLNSYNYEDEFPLPTRQHNDYRHYKKRNYHEEDEYSEPEPFLYEPRAHYGRHSRGDYY